MNKNIIIPLLCQCGLFIHTCLKIQLCLKIWYSTFFDITWYAEAAICKKSSFVSFYSFLVKFSQWDRGSDRVKLTVWQSPMGVKNAIMQLAYFLNGPMFNLLFYCHIILYWEKVTSFEKFSQNLTLEVQIVWKISVF